MSKFRLCPTCHHQKNTQGFNVHEKACSTRFRDDKFRSRYASQLVTMTPLAQERFLRKAKGG